MARLKAIENSRRAIEDNLDALIAWVRKTSQPPEMVKLLLRAFLIVLGESAYKVQVS